MLFLQLGECIMYSAEQCQQILNNLFHYSLRAEFQAERQMARELYFVSTGNVNDDDACFDQRMACFQEFFVFEYRLLEQYSGSTIFETFLARAAQQCSLDELQNYEQFRSFKHSLFEVLTLRGDSELEVLDVFSGSKACVHSLPEFNFSGFSIGQIFDGRFLFFHGKTFFTGAFILHPKEVQPILNKTVEEFLVSNQYCQAGETVSWDKELESRQKLFRNISQQKQMISNTEKKKAVDLLRVTRQIAAMPRLLSNHNLVMALAKDLPTSVYIPETAFFDMLSLMHQLAYKELKCLRYKHIDPIKIYEGPDEHLDHIQMPKVLPSKHIPQSA